MSKKIWCVTEKRMNVCMCNSKKSIRNCKEANDREGLRCPHDVQNRFGSPTYQSHVVRSKCIYIYTHFYFCSCIFIIQSKYIDWCLDYNTKSNSWIKSVHFLEYTKVAGSRYHIADINSFWSMHIFDPIPRPILYDTYV